MIKAIADVVIALDPLIALALPGTIDVMPIKNEANGSGVFSILLHSPS